MRILVLNGPNLNLLGQRPSSHYGEKDLEAILEELRKEAPDHDLDHVQTNHEGELIDALQRADQDHDGVILNPGGFTHSSVALGDCVEAIEVPVIEVHLSNILARESFRHRSYIAAHAVGSIMGMGADGYRLALEGLLRLKGS